MTAFSNYIVYVDESGDHGFESIDPEYPLLVLSFCVFRKDGYANTVTPAIRRLKFEVFGHDMVILHESDIRRKRGAFSHLSKEPREAFLNRLSDIIGAADFKLVAVVIDKRRLKDRYPHPANPYHLALKFGLERIHRLLKSVEMADALTFVICEARGSKEDAQLELAFRRIRDGDNFSHQTLPFELIIADKKVNSEGLQLADLTARPIGLGVLRPDQGNRAMALLQTKFCLDKNGKTVGLKIFPQPLP